MKNIKVLPDGLIDRIAAGEVIENPASVIKELMENSIDAGARNIEIGITGGGKDEITIVDDGEGIPKDQVEVAFYRHATSKIKNFDDILRTFTMGFRGEALPSISSVSIMELSTHYEGEPTGTSIKFEGGKQVHLGPAPPRKGCAISVRNLFYNVPARRKFLKSDTSEKRKIAEIIRRYIIAHPEIGFKIFYDGKQLNSLAASENLLNRLESVWGDSITKALLKLDQPTVGPLQITGLVSKPETNRGSRSEIFFFVNKRPVLERALYGVIPASYGYTLPPGRYPYAAVFLEIDPGFVDINVHPAKTEVRFADDGFIFSTLKKAFDRALALPVGVNIRTAMPETSTYAESDNFNGQQPSSRQESLISYPPTLKYHFKEIESTPIPSNKLQQELTSPDESYLQIFSTYIITRNEGQLIFLDQHAAHERILFERNLDGFNRVGAPSQKLLFEERVKLTPEEFSLVESISAMLSKAGFELRQFGPDEIIISGQPQEMDQVSPHDALKEVLAVYSSNLKDGFETKRALAAALACKAAVKAGQHLSEPQMKGLFHELFRCREPYRCPHGRPTIAVMGQDDFERIFKRK
jgi:DNA mismatch repair protein MutL